MKKGIIFASLATLILAGCANTNNPTIGKLDSIQIANMINNGKTTKAEIRAQFGDPNNVDFKEGSEKWSYKHTKSATTFSHEENDTTKELIVLFDENNLVKKHAFSTSTGETKFGIVG